MSLVLAADAVMSAAFFFRRRLLSAVKVRRCRERGDDPVRRKKNERRRKCRCERERGAKCESEAQQTPDQSPSRALALLPSFLPRCCLSRYCAKSTRRVDIPDLALGRIFRAHMAPAVHKCHSVELAHGTSISSNGQAVGSLRRSSPALVKAEPLDVCSELHGDGQAWTTHREPDAGRAVASPSRMKRS